MVNKRENNVNKRKITLINVNKRENNVNKRKITLINVK